MQKDLITDEFNRALTDYYYLLIRNYPQKTILEIIGTRYSLSRNQRSMLYRGICLPDKARIRQDRLVGLKALKNEIIHIDLFNVLLTISAYLRGIPVFISSDGILRDAAENHGASEWEPLLMRSIKHLLEYIPTLRISKVIFYIDKPMDFSIPVAESMQESLKSQAYHFEIFTDDSPDQLISKVTGGIIASSDSTIIDRSTVQIFDLPRNLLEYKYEPDFIRLDNIAID